MIGQGDATGVHDTDGGRQGALLSFAGILPFPRATGTRQQVDEQRLLGRLPSSTERPPGPNARVLRGGSAARPFGTGWTICKRG